MKIHANIQHIDGDAGAEFEPPEGAVDVKTAVVVCGSSPCLVVTWIELSPSERAELMMRAQQQSMVMR